MVFKLFHSFIKLSFCTAKNHDFREYENTTRYLILLKGLITRVFDAKYGARIKINFDRNYVWKKLS